MRKLRMVSVLAAVLVLGAVVAASSFAQQASCELTDQSTDEALPGVTLTWDSSFRCRNAPDSGTYEIDVTVSNHADSAEAVTIDDLTFDRATPRPRGRTQAGNDAEAFGLPITVASGESDSFHVSGTYRLVQTDEGKKINHHLSAHGEGVDSGDPFKLGINVHLRAPGVED